MKHKKLRMIKRYCQKNFLTALSQALHYREEMCHPENVHHYLALITQSKPLCSHKIPHDVTVRIIVLNIMLVSSGGNNY